MESAAMSSGETSAGESGAAAARPPRNPWMIVGGSGIAQAFSAQPLILSTFSLFLDPLAGDTGWGRASILAAFTACALGMALGMPIVGKLIDRFAVRRVLILSWLGYCASAALIGLVPLSLPLYYLPFLMVGLFGSGILIPFTKAVLSWFDHKRGTAIGVMAALMGLGTTFTPLLARFLIDAVGYRSAYLWLALCALVAGIAMILPFAHARGEEGAAVTPSPSSARPGGNRSVPGLSVREAVRTRHFWIIAVALCLAGITVVGVQANLVPILTGRGIALDQATVALSIFGFASLLGRLGGVLLDRFHGTYVGAGVLFMAVIGLVLLMADASFATAVVGAVLVGFAFGMEIDLLAFLTSRYFGMRHFGSLLGILQGAAMLCIATGPLIVGLLYDRVGGYDGILPMLAGSFGLCGALLLILGPYPYPAASLSDRNEGPEADEV